MEGWIVAASVIAAFGGLIAADAAIWLAFLNKRLVEASQEQARLAQEQLFNQRRPLLVPEKRWLCR